MRHVTCRYRSSLSPVRIRKERCQNTDESTLMRIMFDAIPSNFEMLESEAAFVSQVAVAVVIVIVDNTTLPLTPNPIKRHTNDPHSSRDVARPRRR